MQQEPRIYFIEGSHNCFWFQQSIQHIFLLPVVSRHLFLKKNKNPKLLSDLICYHRWRETIPMGHSSGQNKIIFSCKIQIAVFFQN